MAMPAGFMDKECSACLGGEHPLLPAEIDAYLDMLRGGWSVVDGHHLEKAFTFKNFRQSLDFTIVVGELAEQQGHHPDIHLSWGRVLVLIWTHKINGLHENDFILANKVDALLVEKNPGDMNKS